MRVQWKLSLYIIVSVGLLFIMTALKAHATRGVQYQDVAGKEVGFYQNSYALVVGASAYGKGWPKLPGVVDDLNQVSKALKIHGFEVTVVRDPDHRQLRNAFNDFINNYGQAIDNRLLFYFAGHGYTKRLTYGAEMGYIVPVDAPNPDLDMSGFLAKALDMQQFEVYARRIESKHALFLFDSCFSGSIFALERAIPGHISYKTARPVRQFITSGSADETVPDTSIFRQQFLAALDGEGDVNQDGYITASELGEFLFEKVVLYSDDAQHPQYGKIRDMYLDKGDFVFLLHPSDDIKKKAQKGKYYVNTKPEYTIDQKGSSRFENAKKVAPKPSQESNKIKIDFTNRFGMEFVLIEPGTFIMGNNNYKDESPEHKVTISRPFYMQTTVVTDEQYRKVHNWNWDYSWEDAQGIKYCKDCPADFYRFDSAQDFIKKLNEKENTDKYRLPTEAEWEYSRRAGTITDYPIGNEKTINEDIIKEYAWIEDYPKKPVKGKKPNPWGIYGMNSYVSEWTQDRSADYESDPVRDPTGPGFWGRDSVEDRRMVRGGRISRSFPYVARCSYRRKIDIYKGDHNATIRLVRDPD